MSTRHSWAAEGIQGRPGETLFQKGKERLGIPDSSRALAWPRAWAPFPAQEEARGRKSLNRPHRRGLEKGQGQVSTSAILKKKKKKKCHPLQTPSTTTPQPHRTALALWPLVYLQPSKQGRGTRARQERGRGQPALPLSHAGLSRLSWNGEGNETSEFRVLTNILAQTLKFRIGTVFH